MSNVSDWDTSDPNNNAAPPNGAPEGWAPSAVNDTIRAIMGALARWYEDTAGSLASGGSGNTYTLTTNNAHSALADQSFLVFRIDRANTGAATLNVDGLGAKSLRKLGQPLAAGDLLADVIAFVVYNATDDAYDMIGGYGVGSINVSGTTAVDLVDTDNPLNVGNEAGGHLAFDPDSIQAKDDATTAGGMNINALGGAVAIGPQTGSGSVTLYDDTVLRLQTTNGGAQANGTVLELDNTGAATNTAIQAANSQGGHAHYVMSDGEYRLYQTDETGGVQKIWIVAERDAAVGLRHNNSVRLVTTATGITIDNGVSSALMTITGADATGEGGQINIEGAGANPYVAIDNSSNGSFRILVNDGGEVALNANPNGAVNLYYDNASKFATTVDGAQVAGNFFASAELSSATLDVSGNAAADSFTQDGDAVTDVAQFASGFENNSSSGNIVVSFGKTFAAAPIVTITQVATAPGSSTNANLEILAGSISTTGFTAYVPGDVPSARRSFNWIAIESGI